MQLDESPNDFVVAPGLLLNHERLLKQRMLKNWFGHILVQPNRGRGSVPGEGKIGQNSLWGANVPPNAFCNKKGGHNNPNEGPLLGGTSSDKLGGPAEGTTTREGGYFDQEGRVARVCR